jgi:hypothetical protein
MGAYERLERYKCGSCHYHYRSSVRLACPVCSGDVCPNCGVPRFLFCRACLQYMKPSELDEYYAVSKRTARLRYRMFQVAVPAFVLLVAAISLLPTPLSAFGIAGAMMTVFACIAGCLFTEDRRKTTLMDTWKGRRRGETS